MPFIVLQALLALALPVFSALLHRSLFMRCNVSDAATMKGGEIWRVPIGPLFYDFSLNCSSKQKLAFVQWPPNVNP